MGTKKKNKETAARVPVHISAYTYRYISYLPIFLLQHYDMYLEDLGNYLNSLPSTSFFLVPMSYSPAEPHKIHRGLTATAPSVYSTGTSVTSGQPVSRSVMEVWRRGLVSRPISRPVFAGLGLVSVSGLDILVSVLVLCS